MPRQLTFDLPVRTALGRDDFFVSPANALAVAMIDAPESWPLGKLLLVGPEGSGKSHLATVWAGQAGAATLGAVEVEGNDPDALAKGALVIEDAERIAGRAVAEETLFHLHNMMLARGHHLLLTARKEPRNWGLALPDLKSRLEGTALVRLEPPDDALLSAVILKLFADRQVQVPPTLVPYLVTRIDRSFAAARELVAELDARALALGRPVSRALAAELLDSPR
ncbi:DnaA/Hda family protein [Frigidibacter sp. RF13]|uniref:DnaA ATPase domain-containing protein n=1 Tax=Frigidibacter sp. RF13 TaxID=2997340 RepID=UPI00226E4A7E|nr:DnaA/Hda family protein [Frigidibacter sp. RF13]MCY1128510.1 DnaA/Hda family protein [Frigidibacter sp. RF13]